MLSTPLIPLVGVSKLEGFQHILLTECAIALSVTARHSCIVVLEYVAMLQNASGQLRTKQTREFRLCFLIMISRLQHLAKKWKR